MLHMPIKDVIEKIKEETGLSEEAVQEQIKIKLQSLEGLVSEEGAAYIVASELGVKLFKDVSSGTLKIKNVLAGMQNIEIIGRIIRVRQPISFVKSGKKSEVASIVVRDDSGAIRVVIWDKRVDWIKEGKLREGVIVKVKDAYAKESSYGGREIHLSNRSKLIIEPEGVDIPLQPSLPDKKIINLGPQERANLLATVVKIFRPRFYSTCPQCGKKVEATNDGLVCSEHKIVEPKLAIVLNLVLDDGTETIRAVAFRETAERLIGLNAKEVEEILTKDGEAQLQEQLDDFLLGRRIKFTGRMNENKAFERMEFQINSSILNPNPRALALNLLGGGQSA